MEPGETIKRAGASQIETNVRYYRTPHTSEPGQRPSPCRSGQVQKWAGRVAVRVGYGCRRWPLNAVQLVQVNPPGTAPRGPRPRLRRGEGETLPGHRTPPVAASVGRGCLDQGNEAIPETSYPGQSFSDGRQSEKQQQPAGLDGGEPIRRPEVICQRGGGAPAPPAASLRSAVACHLSAIRTHRRSTPDVLARFPEQIGTDGPVRNTDRHRFEHLEQRDDVPGIGTRK